MSPFRDAPPVELGSLEVGLAAAAARAVVALPTGGRVVVKGRPRSAGFAAYALGSIGLFSVIMIAVAAAASRWTPSSVGDLGLCFLVVILGGLSLAAVMRALDPTAGPLTRSGVSVQRRARGVLHGLGLAEQDARSPRGLAAGYAASLRRALDDTMAADLAPWIPDDVRGRVELLLARATALQGGPTWAADDALRERVRALLVSAAERLDDPTPARRDLAAIDGAPRSLRLRVLAAAAASDDDEASEADEVSDDEASAPAAIPRRL